MHINRVSSMMNRRSLFMGKQDAVVMIDLPEFGVCMYEKAAFRNLIRLFGTVCSLHRIREPKASFEAQLPSIF